MPERPNKREAITPQEHTDEDPRAELGRELPGWSFLEDVKDRIIIDLVDIQPPGQVYFQAADSRKNTKVKAGELRGWVQTADDFVDITSKKYSDVDDEDRAYLRDKRYMKEGAHGFLLEGTFQGVPVVHMWDYSGLEIDPSTLKRRK